MSSALIYSDLRDCDLGYKHRGRILNAGGGAREEGERGQDSRRLQAGEGVASAARTHDRAQGKEETRPAASLPETHHLGCGVKPSHMKQPSCRPLSRGPIQLS